MPLTRLRASRKQPNASLVRRVLTTERMDLEASETAADARRSVSQRLREGRIADAELDEVYPPSVRRVSPWFWTPIAVAVRAAELLVTRSSTRVLDIGSGAGKFCIVGAATTGAWFTGIEHREHLVHTARVAAWRLGVGRARFLHGTPDAVDIESFDAVYFFNPFEENLWDDGDRLDDTVTLSEERFVADLAQTMELLSAARTGTRVVTYHGFGGEMPRGFVRAVSEHHHTGYLELWVKTCEPPHLACAYGRCAGR